MNATAPSPRRAFAWLDLGLDPREAAPDLIRRTRILVIAHVLLIAIAAVSFLQYWAAGPQLIAWLLAGGTALGVANLGLLWRTRRPGLASSLGLLLLTSLLLIDNALAGGFYDPNFAWLYVLPLAAAVALGPRAAAGWLGATLLITVGFWGLPELGVPIGSPDPPETRAVQSLVNRVTALLAIGGIALGFVAAQRRSERELAAANERLQDEGVLVELLRHAAVAANESIVLEEACRLAVEHICKTTSWPIGRVYWQREPWKLTAGDLHLAEDSESFRALAAATERIEVTPGPGLLASVLSSGRPEFSIGVGDRVRTAPGLRARDAGVETAMAVPVVAHGETLAILLFCSRTPLEPTPGLMQALADIGIQLGRVAERAGLQERLRQSQKIEAVGRLAAGIAHEINNPMAFVRSNLNLLRQEWQALRKAVETGDVNRAGLDLDDVEALLDESLAGVERTVSIVRSVQEFSHQGAGERDAVDLRETLEGAIRVASARAGHGISLRTALEPVPGVFGAEVPLRQVFVNLIVNAIQAIGDSGEVRIGCRRDGAEVVATVEDDGPGIAESARERLFDPFFTTKPIGEGTGLGLYVSWEIVRRHEGTIRVVSEPGRGACFEVRLPVVAAD